MKKLFLFLMLLFFGFVGIANALTIGFTGTINEVRDDYNVLDGSISIGTSFRGSYSIDENISPFIDSDPLFDNYYLYLDSVSSFNVEIGNYNGIRSFQQKQNFTGGFNVFDNSYGSISDDDEGYFDIYHVNSSYINQHELIDGELVVSDIDISLLDYASFPNTPSAITESSNLLSIPNLASFNYEKRLGIAGGSGANDGYNTVENKFNIYGTIESMYYESTSVPVPEPTTMLLLGTGLAGLAGFRRKLKKDKR